MIKAPLYALHVDGTGCEYCTTNQKGESCLFLFSDQESACAFVAAEPASHQGFTAVEFVSLEMIVGFLSDIESMMTFIAIDPPNSKQFTPIPIGDVLRDLRSRCN